MFLILAVIYIVFISLGLPDSVFGVSWPVIHTEFGLPESFGTIYSIVTGICTGLAGVLSGKVLRKFGTPVVTVVSIIMTAIGLFGMSISPNIYIMMLFAIILGFGAGAIDTGLNNYVSLHYSAKHMNWLHCFWGVGVTVSPLIMSAFLSGETGNWRNGFRVIMLLQIIIAVIALLSVKKWKKQDTIKEDDDENKTNEKAPLKGINGLFPSILSLGFYCSVEFMISSWGATYFVNVFNADASTASKWVSFYFGGIMLGRLVSGFISMKLNDNNMIRCGAVVSALGMIVLLLPFSVAPMLGFLLIGFGFGPIFPSVIHSVPFRFGKKFSADYTGYHMASAYTVGFSISFIFGFVASGTSFAITPYVMLALITIVFILNEVSIKRINHKQSDY